MGRDSSPAADVHVGPLRVWRPAAGVDARPTTSATPGVVTRLNTKALSAQIEALRAEIRQGFAELRLDFHTEISQLTHRVERLEEQRGLVRP